MGDQRLNLYRAALDHRDAFLERSVDGKAPDNAQILAEDIVGNETRAGIGWANTENPYLAACPCITEGLLHDFRDARHVSHDVIAFWRYRPESAILGRVSDNRFSRAKPGRLLKSPGNGIGDDHT